MGSMRRFQDQFVDGAKVLTLEATLVADGMSLPRNIAPCWWTAMGYPHCCAGDRGPQLIMTPVEMVQAAGQTQASVSSGM